MHKSQNTPQKLTKKNFFVGALAYCGISTIQLSAQEEPEVTPSELELIEKYFEMSPEELLNHPTRITTASAQDWLSTPAAAYLITQEEIQHSGHRHIAEAPGYIRTVLGTTWKT